ncbi:unnamed protein product [Rotaria socialis]|uniref:Uncharacterized protein n=1 Tax=Rotaria socialis TaxID=392032 RepID=A0A817U435_9BILA|nr:unnamed protein product [Rotaria socialis]
MHIHTWILFFLSLLYSSLADHYKGGSISWRPVQGTTTYNTLFTTTGVPVYITSTSTSTTATTSTSATTTTTTSATTTTTGTTTTTQYISNAVVIYPKDMELACVQPVAISAVIITSVMIPIHFLAMINLFVKMNSLYHKNILGTRRAYRKHLKRVYTPVKSSV